ncbi:MAG: hypothetical protein Q7S62_01435 [bacterium]|nr:hypothetical protein [bacterium]
MWIHKLQQLPEKKRKIILWGILVVIALVMIVWWIDNIRETFIRYGGQ